MGLRKRTVLVACAGEVATTVSRSPSCTRGHQGVWSSCRGIQLCLGKEGRDGFLKEVALALLAL